MTFAWRTTLLLGLVCAPAVKVLIAALPRPQIDAGYGAPVLVGLLVGVGTRHGSGCSSGHGVCSLSRLSPHSFMATLAFMGTGLGTVFAKRHLLGS